MTDPSTTTGEETATLLSRASMWSVSSDTGISSRCIWSVMMGITPERNCTPCDPSDFGRCYRLLKLLPEWEEQIEKMRFLSEQWDAFVDNYKKMCELYEEEKPSRSAPKLYKLMQDLGL